MCDPATIILGTSLAIQVGSEIAHGAGQNKAAKANKAAAEQSLNVDLNVLSDRKVEEQAATSQTIMQADRQARTADALTRLSAGEAGVAGASVDALTGDIDAQLAQFKSTEKTNLDLTLKQIDRQAAGASALAQSRINGVQSANPFATSLAIAGHGVDFANTIRQRKPALPTKG